MAAEDTRQPDLQIVAELVLEGVPKLSLPQRESHCLYRGYAVEVKAMVAMAKSFANIFCNFIIIINR
jgi:hypothetical protein